MTRQIALTAILATAVGLAGPVTETRAQLPYAIRGGPIYGGPVYGGGPTLYTGSYAPPFFGRPLTGAGFGPAYFNHYPQYNGFAANASLPVYVQPMFVSPPSGIVYYQPPPSPPKPPDGTLPPSGTSTEAAKPSGSAATAPTPPPAPKQPAVGRAWFTVSLPADAKLWVNDSPTVQTGAARRFHTPADLDPTRTYEYLFRAQWTDGGQTVTRDKTIRFKAGDDLAVDFAQAAAR